MESLHTLIRQTDTLSKKAAESSLSHVSQFELDGLGHVQTKAVLLPPQTTPDRVKGQGPQSIDGQVDEDADHAPAVGKISQLLGRVQSRAGERGDKVTQFENFAARAGFLDDHPLARVRVHKNPGVRVEGEDGEGGERGHGAVLDAVASVVHPEYCYISVCGVDEAHVTL